MTAIVYNPSEGLLVADKRVTCSYGMFSDHACKIYHGQDFVSAAAGSIGSFSLFIEPWHTPGEQTLNCCWLDLVQAREHLTECYTRSTDTNSHFSFFLFYKHQETGVLVALEWSLGGVFTMSDTKNPIGIGAGSDMAIGAILAGASAKRSVELTAKMNNTVSPSVDVCDVFKTLGIKRTRKKDSV